MYFMSDLSRRTRTLDAIEQNLRMIFPPALRSGYLPQDYANFQATTIRSLFDHEPFNIKKGELTESERLWETFGKSQWANTPRGNRLASEILAMHGIVVKKAVATAETGG